MEYLINFDEDIKKRDRSTLLINLDAFTIYHGKYKRVQRDVDKALARLPESSTPEPPSKTVLIESADLLQMLYLQSKALEHLI